VFVPSLPVCIYLRPPPPKTLLLLLLLLLLLSIHFFPSFHTPLTLILHFYYTPLYRHRRLRCWLEPTPHAWLLWMAPIAPQQ
jgi:hypothetical protein